MFAPIWVELVSTGLYKGVGSSRLESTTKLFQTQTSSLQKHFTHLVPGTQFSMKFSAASILFLAQGIAAMPWSSGKANEDIT